jgi:hypothetical protein
MSAAGIFQLLGTTSPARVCNKGKINSDLPAVLRHHVQALGGQLSYSDRHMVLPFETSDRLDMG